MRLLPMFRLLFSLCLALVLSSTAARAEMRAVWISTVWNINWPSKTGLSAAVQQQQLINLLDTAKSLGCNAVLFQVRPEADALYASNYEPWSRFLTGTQGKSPGYDPLQFCITEAKKRGLAVHAWFNPYRASTQAGAQHAVNHVSNTMRSSTFKVGTLLWLDPGSADVQRQNIRVVLDVVKRYDIAGVHLDDYFYPYPKGELNMNEFPDEATYQRYKSGGGSLDKAAWRRDNVNNLIKNMHAAIKSVKPGCQFGVSPFGIYHRGVMPPSITVKLDPYDMIFCDPVKWMQEGWVDYLAPQLYWKEGSPQSFSTLLGWWRGPQANPRGVPIVPGICVSRLIEQNWPADEIIKQVRLAKDISGPGSGGYIFWNIDPLQKNTKNITSLLKN